jgi:predicted amidohydrolase YtcJ
MEDAIHGEANGITPPGGPGQQRPWRQVGRQPAQPGWWQATQRLLVVGVDSSAAACRAAAWTVGQARSQHARRVFVDVSPPAAAAAVFPQFAAAVTLPPLDQLAGRFRDAHAAGRPVAVHCVTRVQLVLTLAALDLAGRLPGDRIEHGAVIGRGSLADLRGLTVVAQPHFVAERGEQYTADVPTGDLPDLWRPRSLIDAGVSVAGGSDAPFGNHDPWHAMRAAVHRSPQFRTDEAVSPAAALALFLGEPAAPGVQRLVARGRPADLTLLRAGPLEALRSLSSDLVAATFVGGEVIYARG